MHPGDVLAKIPRETTKTKDITGGVAEGGGIIRGEKTKRTGGGE